MKLTKETIEILENFAEINAEFLFREGSKISTLSKNRSLICEAEIKEYFPKRVAVSDLTKILSCSKTIGDDSDFYFSENALKISNGNSDALFGLVAEEQITFLKKTLSWNLSGIRFEITSNVIKQAKSYARLMRSIVSNHGSGKKTRLGNLYLIGNGENIYLEVSHRFLGGCSDKLTLALNEPSYRKFNIGLDIELLKMIDDDYVCEISEPSTAGSVAMTIFTGKNKPVKYFIASNTCDLTPEVESNEETPNELIAEG